MLPQPQYGRGGIRTDTQYFQRVDLHQPDHASVRPGVTEVERELKLSPRLQRPGDLGGSDVDWCDDRAADRSGHLGSRLFISDYPAVGQGEH